MAYLALPPWSSPLKMARKPLVPLDYVAEAPSEEVSEIEIKIIALPNGLLFAVSDDLRGLLVCAGSPAQMADKLTEAVLVYYVRERGFAPKGAYMEDKVSYKGFLTYCIYY